MRLYEEIVSYSSPSTQGSRKCCEVEYQGKLREFALMEQINRERRACCQKVIEAEKCCCLQKCCR